MLFLVMYLTIEIRLYNKKCTILRSSIRSFQQNVSSLLSKSL